jgi:nitrite reductase (NO-forming)
MWCGGNEDDGDWGILMNQTTMRLRRFPALLVSILAIVVLVVSTACGTIDGSDAAASNDNDHAGMNMNMDMGASATVAAAPANLTSLPQPAVAPPVGNRGPQLVKYEMTAEQVTGKLDDGVAFTYWTFDGTVPGPMLRVREGDTVQITLHNAPSDIVAHSIDLHAVSGPGGGATVSQVSPGHTAVFQFLAETPGTYVYHCATPPAAMHIAMGMFGLIVVEPAGGLPAVDHEYYVMQSEFYLTGQRGEPGLQEMSTDKMMDENPDYVVFNGEVGALTGENMLQDKTGETVRIFFGDAGPNLTSSFHVIGQIMKSVAVEGGSLINHNVQTTTVPAGGATMIELQPDVPGNYMFVDHALSRTLKGAAGMIHVTGPDNPGVFQTIQPGDAGTGGH